MGQQGNRNKNKNKQMGPNQTYMLLHSKGNHKQNEKTTNRMGENNCKWYDQQRINFQNIQITHTTKQWETKIKINKWGLIKLKSFITTKVTINKMKRQPTEWEKIFANNMTNKG